MIKQRAVSEVGYGPLSFAFHGMNSTHLANAVERRSRITVTLI